jgi:hypothetical protein
MPTVTPETPAADRPTVVVFIRMLERRRSRRDAASVESGRQVVVMEPTLADMPPAFCLNNVLINDYDVA